MKVGERIDIYKVVSEGYIQYYGKFLPAMEPEHKAVVMLPGKWFAFALYTENVAHEDFIECRKVGTMVIKSFKTKKPPEGGS